MEQESLLEVELRETAEDKSKNGIVIGIGAVGAVVGAAAGAEAAAGFVAGAVTTEGEGAAMIGEAVAQRELF